MTTDPNQSSPVDIGGLTKQVRSSVASASWLTKSDDAAVELALMLASRIDAEGSLMSPRDLTTVSNALAGVLRDLGLSVAGRGGKPEPAREVSPLDELRSLKPVRVADAKVVNTTK